MDWAEKVKRLVSEQDISFRRVERHAEMKENTLKGAIASKANLGIDKALSLAQALDVSVEWLFDPDQDWPPPMGLEDDTLARTVARLRELSAVKALQIRDLENRLRILEVTREQQQQKVERIARLPGEVDATLTPTLRKALEQLQDDEDLTLAQKNLDDANKRSAKLRLDEKKLATPEEKADWRRDIAEAEGEGNRARRTLEDLYRKRIRIAEEILSTDVIEEVRQLAYAVLNDIWDHNKLRLIQKEAGDVLHEWKLRRDRNYLNRGGKIR